MLIQNGRVFTEKFIFENADMRLQDGRIRQVSREPLLPEPGEQTLDAGGLLVIPGLVDIHFHGCAGHDFSDAGEDGLFAIAAYENSIGVTSICPATMTLPEERLSEIVRGAAAHKRKKGEAALVGIHLEGPYISPEKVGAQNPDYVQTISAEAVSRLLADSRGLLKLMTVAPEQPGVPEVIREFHDRICFSVGHTNASYEDAERAFSLGARHMTHLFNAMPPLHHRMPGPIAAGAEHPDVMAEIITDGIHVAPAMIRFAFRLFGPERMILISDSCRACGMPDGRYELGGQEVIKRSGAAWLPAGNLAASACDLFEMMRRAVSFGIPLEDAVRAATANPADSIGEGASCGRIAEGLAGRVLLVTPELSLVRVVDDSDGCGPVSR